MTNEQLRMQMLAGIITEGQYKEKMDENKSASTIEELEPILRSTFPDSEIMLKQDEEGDGVLIDGIYVSEGAYQKWDSYIEATDEEKSFMSDKDLIIYLSNHIY